MSGLAGHGSQSMSETGRSRSWWWMSSIGPRTSSRCPSTLSLPRPGIGATLIEAVAWWAQQQGFDAMTLMTFRDVPWSRPYYERLGFRVVDEAQLTSGLRKLQAHEATLGINRWPRVAMRRRVDVLAPR
jgi:hypothetical protein